MNWITNFVRPKLRAFVGKKEIPDNLWETCPKCSQMLLKRELESNLFVLAARRIKGVYADFFASVSILTDLKIIIMGLKQNTEKELQ